jgi:hypothetical protein
MFPSTPVHQPSFRLLRLVDVTVNQFDPAAARGDVVV